MLVEPALVQFLKLFSLFLLSNSQGITFPFPMIDLMIYGFNSIRIWLSTKRTLKWVSIWKLQEKCKRALVVTSSPKLYASKVACLGLASGSTYRSWWLWHSHGIYLSKVAPLFTRCESNTKFILYSPCSLIVGQNWYSINECVLLLLMFFQDFLYYS